MRESQIQEIFTTARAILTDGHFVFTEGQHSSSYLNKDAIYLRPRNVSELGRELAEYFSRRNPYALTIGAVAAPVIGGIILSQWTAYWLTELSGFDVLAMFAEPSAHVEEFVFNRGYAKEIPNRRVLVVEDVITTGSTARKVVAAVRAAGGYVTGVGGLCNRGKVTRANVGNPPELFALLNVTMDAWDESECPLCAQGVPINTEVGKGKEYLARNAAA